MTETGPDRGNAVCLICTDHRRTATFYRAAFGAVDLPGDGFGCPWLRVGGLTLTLLPNAVRPAPAPSVERAGATLLLRDADVRAAFDRAVAAGAAVVEPPDEDATHCLVADPDGVLIEVMTP
ncbi:VOC family protein [Alienimonas sp. DA493]|uniref:VOC family protein n=1 Tax=Alienimonas sp. DA493 TaxID=3373605 RepID=UPI0037545753